MVDVFSLHIAQPVSLRKIARFPADAFRLVAQNKCIRFWLQLGGFLTWKVFLMPNGTNKVHFLFDRVSQNPEKQINKVYPPLYKVMSMFTIIILVRNHRVLAKARKEVRAQTQLVNSQTFNGTLRTSMGLHLTQLAVAWRAITNDIRFILYKSQMPLPYDGSHSIL